MLLVSSTWRNGFKGFEGGDFGAGRMGCRGLVAQALTPACGWVCNSARRVVGRWRSRTSAARARWTVRTAPALKRGCGGGVFSGALKRGMAGIIYLTF